MAAIWAMSCCGDIHAVMNLTVSTSPEPLPIISGLRLLFFGTRHDSIDLVDKWVNYTELGYVRRNRYVQGIVHRMVIDDLTYP